MLLLLIQDNIPVLAYAHDLVDGDSRARPLPLMEQAWSTEHFTQAEEFRKPRALA